MNRSLLLLAPDFPPSTGGIQTLTWEIYSRLADLTRAAIAGHDARAAGVDPAFGPPVLRTRHAAGGGATMLRHLVEANRLAAARRRPPCLVHCNHLFASYLARWLRLRRGLPYVVWVHGEELGKARHPGWARVCLAGAATILVNSEFTGQLVRERLAGAPAPPVVKIPLGTDAGWWQAPAAAAADPESPPVVLTVARLCARDRYKGIDTMIRAVAELRRMGQPVQYRVAGDGDDRGYLEALAAELGVGGQVQFLGRVPQEQLLAVYDGCDVFALCSREQPTARGLGFEGFGIALLEAGARGKPVLGGRSGGVPDAVAEGVSGLLVDPTDPAAVAAGLLPLLRDPELRRRMGEQGRQRVRDEFNWDRAADAVRAVHSRLVASS